MPTKPTKKPKWAITDVVDGTSGQNNVSEPSETKKDRGWDRSEVPPRQWWNWLLRTIYQWIDWWEVLSDYDRSPLFVDGDGFTAGVGHHVITVPTDWTPTNPDVRFYKVSDDGSVTLLAPTAKTSTTFTISDTLLSTDTVFIGDDKFRNQFDGDVNGIRSRLGFNDRKVVYDDSVGSDTVSTSVMDKEGLYVVEYFLSQNQPRASRWSFNIYFNPEVGKTQNAIWGTAEGAGSSIVYVDVDTDGDIKVYRYNNDAFEKFLYIYRIERIL